MFHADYFLKKHGIVLDTNKSVEEQILLMTVGFGVQDSESGDRPYIFVSYAHKDSAVVLPAIKALQDKGYPVWYDAGIRPGTTWSDYIADHVRDAALVIAFMSKNAIESPHCQSEIRYAFNNSRPMLTVRLDQSELPSGLDMQLSQWQMFPAYVYDGDDYIRNLANDGFVAKTVNPALSNYYGESRKRAEAERERIEAEKAKNQRLIDAEEEIRCLQVRAEILRNENEILAQRMQRQIHEVEVELDRERSRRDRAESALHHAQNRIVDLEDMKKSRDLPKRHPLVAEANKEELKRISKKLEGELCVQSFAGYKNAIDIYQFELSACVRHAPELKPDIEKVKEKFCDTLFHDAGVLERKRKKRIAYALYKVLPNHYGFADARMKAIKAEMEERACLYMYIFFFLYLAVSFPLTKLLFDPDASFWFNVMVAVGPMILTVSLWCFTNWNWFSVCDTGELFVTCLFGIMISSIISLVISPFLYPAIPIWIRILASLGYNVASALIGTAELFIIGTLASNSDRYYLFQIND